MIFSANRHKTAIIAALSLMISMSACDKQNASYPSGSAEAVVEAGVTTATGEEQPSTRRALATDTFAYADIEEKLVYGYFAFPADMAEPLPAIILIHERWGLNDSIRATAQRLAAEEYIVIAIDLFGGKATESTGVARDFEIEVFENPDLASENIRQAYQFLIDTFGAPTIATVGLGFGGGWSLNAAMLLPDDLDASVIFYGPVVDDQEKLSPVQAPLLGLFAEEDRVVRVNSVLDFEAALRALDKDFEVEIYAGVGRGFADTHSTRYDAQIAELAWKQTLDFLEQHLKNNTE